MNDCRCLRPPFAQRDFDSVMVGVDEGRGRFGEVSVETCRICSRRWLRYFVEYEAFPNSGRWYRGLVTDAAARAVRPATALQALEKLEWRFAGGSYFDSTGFRTSEPVRVDP
jgi:hypothetical protein